MRKHKRKLLAAAAVLAVAGFAALGLCAPDPITPENFRRLVAGMSREDVYAILGPPGDYTTGETEHSPEDEYSTWGEWSAPKIKPSDEWAALWRTDRVDVIAWYDDEGRAISASCYVRKSEDGNPLDRFLRRVKRQWRQWFPE